ncbi:MAG TPA: RodZ domain-containing protein [Bryobacteraceae bacterium]|nr:RodZ domain-containing protein [Bryobacteraceae bacterium]
MASVGEILRRERDRQGLDLGMIAEQTRIKIRYLEALERDDFESLPGRFFARSFTAQYANRLGVNTAELQAALQSQIVPVEVFGALSDHSSLPLSGSSWTNRQFTVEPLPHGTASAVTARKLTSSAVMFLAVTVACGTVFWLWQRTQVSSTSVSAAQNEAGSQSIKNEPDPPPAAQSTAQPPPPVPAAVEPAESATAGKINLAVIAKEDTWVRITVDGKVILERVLARGDSSVAAANVNAKVLLGNAGGVDIHFNGAGIGPIGPRGQVRVVDFTRGKFQVVEPPKKPVAQSSLQPVTATTYTGVAIRL